MVNLAQSVAKLSSAVSSYATAAAAPVSAALKSPAAALKAVGTEVFRGAQQSGGGPVSDLAERGIIIVSGKSGSPDKAGATDAATKAGIIVVGGRTPGGNSFAERGIIIVSGRDASPADGVRARLGGRSKQLEGNDRIGNFAIQQLMSAFNQAETLSSNVQKKMDDTTSGQQQKIG
ncbi:MAG TPA: hypothetical protein VEA69_07165 [Tepidisphaeraceae bacterium]|nr:hypothetical protein [Tepidisphaeraceae bacterium]